MKTSEEILEVVVRAADDKIAEEIVALDVKNLTGISDYFVIMQGRNEKHVQAIVDAIEEAVHKNQMTVKSIEGKNTGTWTLLDLNDVIVHVFYPSERAHYNLEKLWSDAPLVDLSVWLNS